MGSIYSYQNIYSWNRVKRNKKPKHFQLKVVLSTLGARMYFLSIFLPPKHILRRFFVFTMEILCSVTIIQNKSVECGRRPKCGAEPPRRGCAGGGEPVYVLSFQPVKYLNRAFSTVSSSWCVHVHSNKHAACLLMRMCAANVKEPGERDTQYWRKNTFAAP